ncbi:MAG: HAD-IB family phosphatase [Candidatus Nezhaarchaeota archaeon]|nr:HAD-IB family phosphatase [Candidatus Nezhaarchaeota archaeon]
MMLLAAFDVDGTLTTIKDSWRYYHQALGTWGQASINAQRFFNREVSYEEWARLDVALWRGVPFRKLVELAVNIPWRKGAHRVAELKRKGYLLYALTTGLSLLAKRTVEELGFDGYLANEVEVEGGGGVLTGGVAVRVEYGGKGKALRRLREELGAEAVVAVGDGRSDVEMFAEADVAIAIEADAEAAYVADLVFRRGELGGVVDFLSTLPRSLKATSVRKSP